MQTIIATFFDSYIRDYIMLNILFTILSVEDATVFKTARRTMTSIIVRTVPRMNLAATIRDAFRRTGYVIKPTIAVTNQTRRIVVVISGETLMSTHRTYVKNLSATWALVCRSAKYATVFEIVQITVMKMENAVCS